MEYLPTHKGYEMEFVTTLIVAENVVVPYLDADNFADSLTRTSAYIMGLIEKYDLHKVADKYTITSGRFTPEHGHHYWVRLWDPK